MSRPVDNKSQVLVIDDDIAFLKMADELLNEAYATSLAKSASQACRLLDSGFVPDVILLDINMPGMNGFEAMEIFREKETLRGVPVIFLTGLTEEEAELKGLRAGATDYITKPFNKDILLTRLQRHIETGRQNRQLQTLLNQKNDIQIDRKKFEEISKTLTETEQKIARYIALGYSNREIAQQLNYSYHYVKKVSGILFEKVGVNRRNELRRLLLDGNDL